MKSIVLRSLPAAVVLVMLLGTVSEALAATPAGTPGPVQSLAGRYSSHFLNGLVDGSTYWSDDVVEIVPVSDDAAYVRVSLQFYNGHSCGIWGVAEAQGNRLVYHDPTQPIIKGERACVLSVSRQGANLLIDDDGNTCKGYCGMRGSLMNDTLPFKSRRPITYMARLKTSSEYNEAIKAWHGVHAGAKPSHPPHQALAARGVAANRMAAKGLAFYAPVASNQSDAGRAQNRRVTLVEQ